jgi:hypothetical protein
MLRAALRRFSKDPKDPLLRTHKLSGDLRDYWSFTVDDDLRVLFRWEGDEAFLVNLSSHDEVYDLPSAAGQRGVAVANPRSFAASIIRSS